MKWNSPSGVLPAIGAEVFVVTKDGSTGMATLGEGNFWTVNRHPVRYTASMDEISMWSGGVSSSGPGFQVPQDTLAEIIAIAIDAERRAEIPNPALLRIATHLRENLVTGVDIQVVHAARKSEMPLFQGGEK